MLSAHVRRGSGGFGAHDSSSSTRLNSAHERADTTDGHFASGGTDRDAFGGSMTPPTLTGIFLDSATRYRNPAMFMRKRDGVWEPISAERAVADVESLAFGLKELGVASGDR